MTFSINARCARTGQIGIAALTGVQSVGMLVCHAVPGIGSIASQALLNPYLAYDGLRLLQAGYSAEQVLERVLAADPEPHSRQLGIVDAQGRTAAWTGKQTIVWSGERAGSGFTTQGNRLAGPQVLERMAQTMKSTAHLDLAERLLRSLVAGAQEGGDVQGERSANVMVFGEEEYPLCDLRVDDHPDATEELQRLYKKYSQRVLPTVLRLPKRSDIPRPTDACTRDGAHHE